MVNIKSAVLNSQSRTRGAPRKRSFIFSFSSLIVFGAALFIGGAFLFPRFVDIVNSLTSVSSGSILLIGFGWIQTFLYGILWLCCLLMFEVAKEDLITLIRK